jgi:Nucleotidyl transferase AbiEii toxin, Type IV TA system
MPRFPRSLQSLPFALAYRSRTARGSLVAQNPRTPPTNLQHFNRLLSAGHHDEVDGATAQWFGFRPPPIPCLSIPYQMAQKLHACTDPYDGTGQRGNDQVRDIVDLWLLEPLLAVHDHRDLRTAVIDTFDRRAKHSWPPAVVRPITGTGTTRSSPPRFPARATRR